VLPDLGPGLLGAVINSLRGAGIIAHTGQMVPSTQENTHGHRIAVWTLTAKGRLIAAKRRGARTQRAGRRMSHFAAAVSSPASPPPSAWPPSPSPSSSGPRGGST
jgi:hypothetical protein